MKPALKWIVPLIFFLTLVACVAGLMPAEGSSFPLVTFRGEAVTIHGRGLYAWDTVSSVAQMQANDFVMLILGLPMLAVSFIMAWRGSLRGRLMLGGVLGFILYTYITMCFGAQYNALFLVYVALLSLSLFAFVLVLMSFDLQELAAHFSEGLPRGWIAGTLFFAAAFLTFAWLGRILPTLDLSPAGWQRGGIRGVPTLENTTSLFIQAMDLAIVVPACVLSGFLLLRRSAWGYLLTSVGLVKFMTLGISVSLMGVNMARVGTADSLPLVATFGGLALVVLWMTILLFRNISEERSP
jgi:hypothetical protein